MQTGFDASTNPRNLQLFAEGNEVAMLVSGEADGKLNPSDSIEFYAQPLASAYDNTRVYWLVAGAQALLNQSFFQEIFTTDAKTLGEATKTKASVGDIDVRRTWVLLSDPSMRVN